MNPLDMPRTTELREWERELSDRAESLRNEIAVLARQLALVEERIELVSRLIALDDDKAADELITKDPSTVIGEQGGTLSGIELEDAVERILLEAKTPLHISTIRQRLIDDSAEIPGRGNEANVIVRLRKQPERFTRTARGTYALSVWGMQELKAAPKRPIRKKAVNR